MEQSARRDDHFSTAAAVQTSLISRDPLRVAIRRILLNRLLSGELEPGSSINESKLAEELGISRTPLREALLELKFEGFLDSVPGKGFSVLPLSAETAWDLYLLVGWLEGVALRNGGNQSEDRLGLLEEIEKERQQAEEEQDTELAVRLDARWHAALVSTCSNNECLDVLNLLRRRLYRYEYVFADDLNHLGDSFRHRVAGTLDHHRQIIEALRARNLEFAVELLKHHWRTGAEIRSEWLRSAEEPAAGRLATSRDGNAAAS